MEIAPPAGATSGRDEISAVLSAAPPERWAPSFFGVIPLRSVRRRPGDAAQLGVATLAVVVCVVATSRFTGRGTALYRTFAELPGWLGSLGDFVFLVGTVGAVAVILGALVVTRNFRLASMLVAVAAIGAALAGLLSRWLDLDAVRQAIGADASQLAVGRLVWFSGATALLHMVAPYLVRPARRMVRAVTWTVVLGAAIGAIGPLAAIAAAVGIGWATSSAACLVVGTPRATPTLASVSAALHDLAISLGDLKLADAQVLGETRFTARTPDGGPASVIVIGRDAADARLARRLWRLAMYRDTGPSIAVSRSSQLEHRAYLLLMAAKSDIPVSSVVLAATAGPDDLALLVLLDRPGRPYTEVPPDKLTDDVLDGLWSTVEHLHAARLTHGQLASANLVLEADGTTGLLDLSFGTAGASSERYDADRVDLLVTTALLVGNDRALAAAARSLGEDGLGALLPLVQTAALSGVVRRGVTQPKKWLKTLREDGAARTGQEAPKLTALRRVSVGSVLMAAATFLGFYLIVNQFAGVDLTSTLSGASLGWVLVAFLFSFVPQFSGSVALMGSVGAPLPFTPVLAEQFANNFTGLIGGTVATTALVIRFFQKQGLKVAVAASSGVMNAIAGSITQVVLVAIGLVFTSTQFIPSSTGGGNIEQLVIVGIVVIGVLVTIGLLVPRLRAAVKQRVGPQYQAAKQNLRAILSDPRKALMIFGGNLCSQVFYALVISAALRAFGVELPLLQIIVINSLASFLGGMAPVPGGMGVIEAGLIGGMTAAGVPQSIAVAATFTARLCTSYLPPIWGWFALNWLRGHDYV